MKIELEGEGWNSLGLAAIVVCVCVILSNAISCHQAIEVEKMQQTQSAK